MDSASVSEPIRDPLKRIESQPPRARPSRRWKRAVVVVLAVVAGGMAIGVGAILASRNREALQSKAEKVVAVARGVLAPLPDAASSPATSAASTRAASAARPKVARPKAQGPKQAAANGRSAGDIAFGQTRWGMTVEEVAAVIGVSHDAIDAGRGPADASTAYTNIGGKPYVVSLLFDGSGRLGAVHVRPAEGVSDLAAAYDEMASWVSAQNGDPATRHEGTSPSGSWIRTGSWSTPASRIELRGWETVREDAPILKVDLSTGDVAAADARGVVLSFEPNTAVRGARP